MSERLVKTPENADEANHESTIESRTEKGTEASEALRNHAEVAERRAKEQVEAARPTEANKVREGLLAEPHESHALPMLNKEQKQQTLRTYLGQIRHGLSPTDQHLSKFIHKPVVNSISEATGKTFFRPSGILTGGLFAFVGSGYYLYAVKQTGYGYSFTLAMLLFIGGFIIGLAAEMAYKLTAKRH
jgi:hypothetical protein